MYLTSCIENVGHDNKIYSLDSSIVFVFDFVKTKESCDKSLWIIDHMCIILLQNMLKSHKLSMTDSLKHILRVRSIVEERSPLPCWALLIQRFDVSSDHWADDVFWTYTFQIIVWRYTIQHPDLMKHSWWKIKELISSINWLLRLLLNQIITIFSIKIFFDYLKCFFIHTVSYRFTNSKDHMQH